MPMDVVVLVEQGIEAAGWRTLGHRASSVRLEKGGIRKR